MDWKTLRRDKLAKTAPYSPRRWQDSWWWRGFSETCADLWARFESFSVWEKGMAVGAIVLVAVVGPLVLVTLTGGGGGSAAAPPPTATRSIGVVSRPTDTPTHTPTNTATSTYTAVPTRTSTPEPVRQDCDEIRGTEYRNEDEREWFLTNCLNPTPGATPTTPGVVPTAPPPPPGPSPAPTPTRGLGMTPAQAVGLAQDWLLSEPTLSELDLVPGSCSARAAGDHWIVSCRVSTDGCVGSCEFPIFLCIEERPLAVWQC
jgi:hypothetical protein